MESDVIMAKTSITINDWIMEEIMCSSGNNRSARIEELIMKGMMYEKEQNYLRNGLYQTQSEKLRCFI